MERNAAFYYRQLYELAASLNSAHAPRAVLDSAVEGVARAIDAKGCSLLLFTPDKKVLMHTVSYGLTEGYARKGPVSADISLSGALAGRVVVVLDATKDERIQYPEEAKKEGIASILSVPAMLRREVIGVIRVYTAKPYAFTSEDIYFVGAVANLAAIALENARLLETVQQDFETLQRDVLEWGARLGGGLAG
jgi:GAF domain-containing protein